MKKAIILVWLLALVIFPAEAQLKDIAKEMMNKFSSAPSVTDTVVKLKPDSLKDEALESEIRDLRLREMQLSTQVELLKKQSFFDDSVKIERRKQSIDSLRAITPGVPVVINTDTLFILYAKRGGKSAVERAADAVQLIESFSKRMGVEPDSVYIYPTELGDDIMFGEKVILVVTDNDALWQGKKREQLSQEYREVIVAKMKELKEEHGLSRLLQRIVLFLLVIVMQYFIFRLIAWLFRQTKRRIIRWQRTRLKPVTIRDYEFLNTHKQARLLIFAANIIRYIFYVLLLIITVPILFAIFPQTESLAMRIFSYILDPLKNILWGVVRYIPNLFTIAIIWLVIKYVVRGIKYLADEVESEKLKITGFFPDWAQPTYNILRFLLYAFMLALIYPHLPLSDSGVFQGISVFVGLIVSLGSSTVIANVIAGLVITYMRPFKIGDFIKLNDTTGNVIEKTPFVTRIKTPKNEVVTIPNSFIMSSHTTNFSFSARNYGLIIHSTVTIGYDAPWRKVHQLLVDAAKDTPGVLDTPEPFVLETALSDFYPVYQINAYIQDANGMARVYSDLHKNIQDKFNAAGVEIMSPHYRAERDGNEITIPKEVGE